MYIYIYVVLRNIVFILFALTFSNLQCERDWAKVQLSVSELVATASPHVHSTIRVRTTWGNIRNHWVSTKHGENYVKLITSNKNHGRFPTIHEASICLPRKNLHIKGSNLLGEKIHLHLLHQERKVGCSFGGSFEWRSEKPSTGPNTCSVPVCLHNTQILLQQVVSIILDDANSYFKATFKNTLESLRNLEHVSEPMFHSLWLSSKTPVKTNILKPKHAGLEDVFPFHKKRSSDFPQETIFRFHGSFRWSIRYVASLEIMNIAKESGTVSCAFYLFQGNTFRFKCWKIAVKGGMDHPTEEKNMTYALVLKLYIAKV